MRLLSDRLTLALTLTLNPNPNPNPNPHPHPNLVHDVVGHGGVPRQELLRLCELRLWERAQVPICRLHLVRVRVGLGLGVGG